MSCIGLLWLESVVATAILLFGLGVGWNISFVAATAALADCTAPEERGQLLGFNDLLSALLGAALALIGGFALDSIGVAALAIGATRDRRRARALDPAAARAQPGVAAAARPSEPVPVARLLLERAPLGA